MTPDFKKVLPLTETTAYILMALSRPLHGYGVMQRAETMSEGTVKVGPGTLYGAFSALEKEGLIEKAGEIKRRKLYILTAAGRQVIKEHIRRTQILVKNGEITSEW